MAGGQRVPVKNTRKGTLGHALRRKDISDDCRRIIDLRLGGAHAAAKKYVAMRNWIAADGRIRGAMIVHGATTGRWTSEGVQLHNMKRDAAGDLDAAVDAIHAGTAPLSVIGDAVRAAIIAAPEHRFIIADFSGVESRITAWLAGEQTKLDQWAEFDRTQKSEVEPYHSLGLKLGFSPAEARARGKTADLAFGYMGGVKAYRKLAPEGDTATDEEIQRQQAAWRDAHPSINRFWHALNSAAVRAVANPGLFFAANAKITFQYGDDFLFMSLPSGRRLAYPFPRLEDDKFGKKAVTFKKQIKVIWTDCRGYGGLWIENAVQAVARDLFAAAMPRLEAAGYPVVLHIHDEIVCEVADGVGTMDELRNTITMAPDWATGLPIAAKVRNGPLFAKSGKPVVKDVKDQAYDFSGASIAPTAEEPPWTAPAEAKEPDTNEEEDDEEEEELEDDAGDNEEDNSDWGGYPHGEEEQGNATDEWIYRNLKGEPYLRVVRMESKARSNIRNTASKRSLDKRRAQRTSHPIPITRTGCR